MTYDIAVLPGDGISPEVVAEALRTLRRVVDSPGERYADEAALRAARWVDGAVAAAPRRHLCGW